MSAGVRLHKITDRASTLKRPVMFFGHSSLDVWYRIILGPLTSRHFVRNAMFTVIFGFCHYQDQNRGGDPPQFDRSLGGTRSTPRSVGRSHNKVSLFGFGTNLSLTAPIDFGFLQQAVLRKI